MPVFDELLPNLESPGRFQDFAVLMSQRVENIILVSSLYDKFILQEDGQLNELILGEFLDLHLHHTTGLTHVSSGSEAIALAQRDPHFSLIITAVNVGDMNAVELALEARRAGLDIPVIVLSYDSGELADFIARHDVSPLDRMFLWQGNARILLAIAKYMEDRLNVDHDTKVAGVQVILVIEDSIRYYSSFLPMIFSEVIDHSQRLIPEGINVAHKLLRMRARPKILLCTTFEEAWAYFLKYQEDILGVISDFEFPREGELDPEAGVRFARMVNDAWPDIPIVLQSSKPANEDLARSVGASFLLKNSPTLLHDLRRLMVEQFSFGDFVFRLPDGTEIDRARDLRSLVRKVRTIPMESLAYHAERNHFSRWLKARTEFALAHRIRPRQRDMFSSAEDMRRDLIHTMEEYRRDQRRVLIADFDRDTFDTSSSFSRVGGGSLGGKARALAFVRHLLNTFQVNTMFPGTTVSVPPSVVIGTDVFEQFLDQNELRDVAIHSDDDEEIQRRFLAATLPGEVERDLRSFLELIRYPLAVRSSSLLEDSQYQPLAGVYETFMLPNTHPEVDVRMRQLATAVKLVYASTFSHNAKSYLQATPYRLEEEKMAVIIQKVVGTTHNDRFYPDISGVARSHNFYPAPPMAAEDGIATVALGLGKTVVGGERAQSFCPEYPKHMMHNSVRDILQNSQRHFWALLLDDDINELQPEAWERRFGLEVAEADGTLAPVASTYLPENDAVYDGTAREGVRLVTFAPLLKFGLFPLPEIIQMLLEMGSRGMATPVEIEFAAKLSHVPGVPNEFGFLQLRPMGISRESEDLDIGEVRTEDLICRSASILGHGGLDSIRDLVVIDFDRFDRAQSQAVAYEVAQQNAELVGEGRPYLLIGVGRWGSADPWLGIPVTWDQISGAKVIVESELKDVQVAPSQGSHFFQNLTSFGVGYFSVNSEDEASFVDWEWLSAQGALHEGNHVRHLRFEDPLLVRMNGKKREGVIFKPGTRPELVSE